MIDHGSERLSTKAATIPPQNPATRSAFRIPSSTQIDGSSAISPPPFTKAKRFAERPGAVLTTRNRSGIELLSILERDADPAGVAELRARTVAARTERLRVHLPAGPCVDHDTVGQPGQEPHADHRRDNPL